MSDPKDHLPRDYKPDDYTVGWICALPTEGIAAHAFFDEKHEGPQFQEVNDTNNYTFGRIGAHNVVVAVLPMGEYGTASAASVAKDMLRSFTHIRIGLMVGIGGGAPNQTHDIRLGDVVVSIPRGGHGGVFQYDFGKSIQERSFQHTQALNQPAQVLLMAVSSLKMQHDMEGNSLQDTVNRALEKYPRLKKKYGRPPQSTDVLFQPGIVHDDNAGDSCESCSAVPANIITREPRTEEDDDPQVHYGTIASANTLMKDARMRDLLASQKDILCFEMEAAGLMNRFPCLVIRGVCDYSDSHKNKAWQGFAAMVAAAYAKGLLCRIRPEVVEQERTISSQLSKVLTGVARTREDIQSLKNAKEDNDVLEWLSDIDFGAQQDDTLSQWQPGTGQWFLGSDRYQCWVQEKGGVLFCPGIPGAGKTILVSAVIQDLTKRFCKDPSAGIAHIYCNFRRKSRQQAKHLLASLLKQLCCRRATVPKIIKDLYKDHKKEWTAPQLGEIKEALKTVVESYSRVFVVADALDEWSVSNGEQSHLVDELLRLHKDTRINLFATSRAVPSIMKRFGHYPSFEITAHQEDIHGYINGCGWRLPQFVINNFELQHDINTTVSQASRGMFLLATFYLRALESQTCARDLKDALKRFRFRAKRKAQNQTFDILSEAYDEAMERMSEQSPNQKRMALQVLLWICCASRELHTWELQHALALKDGDTELHTDGITEVDLLASICCGLVAVDQASETVRLVHYTAQDYFKKNQQHYFPDAHSHIAKQCMNYLSLSEFKLGSSEVKSLLISWLKRASLYNYAAMEWSNHARNAATDHTDEAVYRFLCRKPMVTAATQLISIWPNGVIWEPDRSASVNGLHLAAFYGLDRVVPSLATQCGVDSKDGLGRSALSWAAKAGNTRTIELLLSMNAHLEMASSDGYTPLLQTINDRQLPAVQILLNAGADVNARQDAGSTALHLAAQTNQASIVHLLLCKNARLNISDNHGHIPFTTAVKSGSRSVFELLLKHGAEIDSCGENGRTALIEAARVGDRVLARTLLKRCARVNLQAHDGLTALMEASKNKHRAIVDLLLGQGANPNIQDGNGRTSLIEASKRGYQLIVERLLGQGADPNIQDGNGHTALMDAIGMRHQAIVEMLLRQGADTSFAHHKSHTALIAASARGHRGIVSLLLERRAGSTSSDSGAAMSLACERGSREVVKLLLESGVDPTAHTRRYSAPIMAAANRGHDDIIKLLLDTGSDVDQQWEYGRAVIHQAAINGNESMVRWLIQRGANIHTPDRDGSTPIMLASRMGHDSIVQLLRDEGATFVSHLSMKLPKRSASLYCPVELNSGSD